MIDGLSEILITAISAVTGTGGIAGVLFYRHNKRMRALEAQLKGAEVSKAKIESKADEWHIWKEQCEALGEQNRALIERNQQLVGINAEKEDRHMADLKEKEERFMEQTTYLRGVQRELIAANEREKEHIRNEARLEKERDHYFNWRCFREHGSDKEDCLRRKPKQDVPIKYIPLDHNDDHKSTTTQ